MGYIQGGGERKEKKKAKKKERTFKRKFFYEDRGGEKIAEALSDFIFGIED